MAVKHKIEYSNELEDLLFPVRLIDERLDCNPEYSKRVIGIVDGKPKLLNQCSDRYELVPNVNIFPEINRVLDENGLEYKASFSHINHARFYADYEITDKRFAHYVGGSDKITPMIRIHHSYNGLTKYKIIFGYFRLVCTNGLTIPVEEMKQYNLSIQGKHTASILASFEQLDSMLKKLVNDRKMLETIVHKFDLMGGMVITNVNERIEAVLKACDIAAVKNANFDAIKSISQTIDSELGKPECLGFEGKANDWLVYNAINSYIYDDNRNSVAPEKRIEKDSKVLEFILGDYKKDALLSDVSAQ